MVTIWVPVTVLSNLTTKMRRQAATDQLTGLLNRNGFRAAAEREYALAVRTSTPLCVVVIDLDGFKAVNDWRGHAAGDQMLVELAETWTTRLRRCDIIGRHGGDEFVLLLPATEAAKATRVLERLQDGSPIRWSCRRCAVAAGRVVRGLPVAGRHEPLPGQGGRACCRGSRPTSPRCWRLRGPDRPSSGAGDGNRTRMTSLEGWSSTIELHPRGPRRGAAAALA